jgi:perosamine synthetase
VRNRKLGDIILSPEASIRDAMLAFDKSAIGVVLICDTERRLLGLATEGDVRRSLLAGHGLISPILDVANRQPKVGHTSMSREELVGFLSETIHCLPVVDGENVVHDVLFYDKRTRIPIASPSIGERELRYVTDAVLSGWISSQGKYIGQFEKEFAHFCHTEHAVAVSNGTVALHLALTVAGVQPGDEVIVPAMTFAATANAVRHCHASPLFVDVEPDSWNMDPDQLERCITSRTKAIIPVHLYGNPCRMDRILEIARAHSLMVIEDAAEAHGAEYRSHPVGSLGQLGCFSFYGNKIITTGEGGAVVCNDDALAEKLRILRDHGMSPVKRYWHEFVGYNYRMTNMQAAVGVAQLERWEEIIGAKKRIRSFYSRHLRRTGTETQKEVPGACSVCWLYTLQVIPGTFGSDRSQLMERLKKADVDTRPLFYPLPAMPPYFIPDWQARFPNAHRISQNGLSLPSSVELTDRELARVVAAFNGHEHENDINLATS